TDAPTIDSDPPDSPTDTQAPPVVELESLDIVVNVTLDDQPAQGAWVVQGGRGGHQLTDAQGSASLTLDMTLDGEVAVSVSHPEARTGHQVVRDGETAEFTIELVRYDASDNLDYVFADPGIPDVADTTAQCSHCHKTINRSWYGSPHRDAASNPWVQGIYAGTAALDQSACEQAGGSWELGLEPGTRAEISRCYLGSGTLPDLNACEGGCDETASVFGQCADCHAPGINGSLGDRDLLEAVGMEHSEGVSCDVCHKVESTNPESSEPGVAGWLSLMRPSEEGALGQDYFPLMFGPYPDVPSPVMGAVARDHYQDGSLCGGCHEHWQEALMPSSTLDTERWPEGLPVHTTYSEWQEGPLSDAVACQSCHMPPDPSVGNAADLGNIIELSAGVVPGWMRPAGEVRQHSWVGPRTPESQMLQLAAGLDLDIEPTEQGWLVSATVSNVGPAHYIPTGEPMRQIFVVLAATCEGQPLLATGGSALPAWLGALESKESQESGANWSLWPGAEVGDVIRVVQDIGPLDYSGWGPFSGSPEDGSFADKGLRDERVLGSAVVTSIGEGGVGLDQELPSGDRAYLVRGAELPSTAQQSAEQSAGMWAGAPGMSFQRVMAGVDGAWMVPHHAAVDVVADNRIGPGESASSTHLFGACAEQPQVQAVLLHRGTTWELASQKNWTLNDSLMAKESL
ncbi:MAG: hypothetical protein ACI9VR_003383, partial [Cognaticolwellia sp.]